MDPQTAIQAAADACDRIQDRDPNQTLDDMKTKVGQAIRAGGRYVDIVAARAPQSR